MKVELVHPFLVSLSNTFRTMLHCDVRQGELNLQAGRLHDVSGIIGLSGRAMGMVVVSFSEALALKLSGSLLLLQSDQIDDDVIDAIGELTQTVVGGAKAELAEFELASSLPTVITGHRHRIRFPSNVTPVSVPYETPWGPMKLEVGLTPVNEIVRAF